MLNGNQGYADRTRQDSLAMCVVVATCILWQTCVLADSPLIGSGSIGTTATQPKADISDGSLVKTLLPEDWVGHKFLFMPMSPGVQHYGYQGIRKEGTPYLSEYYHTTPYSELVGKIGTVMDVSDAYGDDRIIHIDVNGTVYVISGPGPLAIVSVSDIEETRQNFLGKTVWVSEPELLTYDAATDKIGGFAIKRYSPVTITDIVSSTSDDSRNPIRVIVKSQKGDVGFLEVHVSNTTTPDEAQKYDRFQDIFLDNDPHKTHKWSPAIWSQIEVQQISLGMTADQVRFSWGDPQTINRDIYKDGPREQWIYNDQYVYLVKGKVTSASTMNLTKN